MYLLCFLLTTTGILGPPYDDHRFQGYQHKLQAGRCILVTSNPPSQLRWPWVLECFFLHRQPFWHLLIYLTRQLLPTHFSAASHGDRDLALSTWNDALPVDTPFPTDTYRQKSRDQLVVHHLFDSLLAHCTDQSSRARFLGACSSESGAWLNAHPVSSLGLRMSNDAIRTAIIPRVGAPICLPHTCNLCGKSAANLDVIA